MRYYRGRMMLRPVIKGGFLKSLVNKVKSANNKLFRSLDNVVYPTIRSVGNLAPNPLRTPIKASIDVGSKLNEGLNEYNKAVLGLLPDGKGLTPPSSVVLQRGRCCKDKKSKGLTAPSTGHGLTAPSTVGNSLISKANKKLLKKMLGSGIVKAK